MALPWCKEAGASASPSSVSVATSEQFVKYQEGWHAWVLLEGPPATAQVGICAQMEDGLPMPVLCLQSAVVQAWKAEPGARGCSGLPKSIHGFGEDVSPPLLLRSPATGDKVADAGELCTATDWRGSPSPRTFAVEENVPVRSRVLS